MKRQSTICGLGILLALFCLASCREAPEKALTKSPHRSIYHWKGTFSPDSTELALLKALKIDRIYLKLFDVVSEWDEREQVQQIVPIATTRFAAPMPKGVEVVPVSYITIEALRAMAGKEKEYAALILERMVAMCSYNECGEIRTTQLDCDWTASTKTSYNRLCTIIRDSLHQRGMRLSTTIRLHQLGETPPPADHGVLMLYNTGALKSPETKNSILDLKDAAPYLKKRSYPLPLDYAYPLFGWGVKFRKGEFQAIVSEEALPDSPEEQIRRERPTAQELIAVKALVEERLGKAAEGNILYHLDDEQLKNYTRDEINQILEH